MTRHESNASVEAFQPDDLMLGALCLFSIFFWAVAVEAHPPLDVATLQHPDVNFL